jgi:hypothetical protein
MSKNTLCAACTIFRDSTVPRLFRTHLVHRRDGMPHLRDLYREAICPTRGALWRRDRGGNKPDSSVGS